MAISNRYNPGETEVKWYDHWEKMNYFHSEPDEREAYSIVIPPPNVTGMLHMGHMLNNTIQDVLIRKARLDGKNACWVPGTDHASIATEAKVVKMLREKGIKKSELTRDEFLKYAWEWKEEYGGIILKQLRKLGASCDWERTAFTMDESRSDAVIKVFVDLFKKKKIYRDWRMINWDPQAKTVLSNEEVLYSEENSHLYHFRYKVVDSDEYMTIATTRPETILGDSAVAVHPKDERYAHLKGRKVIIPLVNREVPIIFDRYVDREFGTGALKVTPAHDTNDYDIGKRHDLEVIEIFNDDATMSEAAQFYLGEDRFVVRKKIVKDLEAAGNLVKIEDYVNKVGRSERTGAVVEPKLSLQWYVDMKSLAGPALENVENDTIRFYPLKQKNIYNHWMNNIRDWCISRQLWWGHRIPAYYLEIDGETKIFVAETGEEALAQAKADLGRDDLKMSDMRQDEDVLDTWFSSWLWPISVFDGFNPDSKDFDYYYPTNVLVTGWDIIFLWVARMIMAGYEWENKLPFKDVYFTGMVRDDLGRKMSKSLGNSPDALGLIEKYGADAVRFGMLSCSPAGGDLLFDEKLLSQGEKFNNKMWNAMKLIKMWEVVDSPVSDETEKVNKLAGVWFENKLSDVILKLEDNYSKFRLSDNLKSLYSFIWDDYCSWYLEMIKPAYGNPIDRKTLDDAIGFFEQLMIILHPYMPFITEEIWHLLREKEAGNDVMMSSMPKANKVDNVLLDGVEDAKKIIGGVRDVRNKQGIKKSEKLKLFVLDNENSKELFSIDGLDMLVSKMAVLSAFTSSENEVDNSIAYVVGTSKYFVELEGGFDTEAEIEKLKKDLDYELGFVSSIQKKLSNERFVNNAPEVVVNNERKKLADGEARVATIKESLDKLLK